MSEHLAETLKNLRRKQGWSLTQTALQTGVSKAMLGQIERRESSPTVATLWRIATGFSVPFSLFISPDMPPQQTGLPATPEMGVKPLFPYDPSLKMDYLELSLSPRGVSQSSGHTQGVIEHVVVISGVLELETGGMSYRLWPGEGKRFAADTDHRYHNPSDAILVFHSLIHYPACGV